MILLLEIHFIFEIDFIFKIQFVSENDGLKGGAKESAFVRAFLGAQLWGAFLHHFHRPWTLGRLEPPVPMPLHVGKCLGIGLAALASGMPPW